MLQRIKRLDACLRVIVQHVKYQVLELPIIWRGVSHFSLPYPPRASCLNTKDIIKGPTPRSSVVVLEKVEPSIKGTNTLHHLSPHMFIVSCGVLLPPH